MNSSACSVVICQPGGHEQKHDSNFTTCVISVCKVDDWDTILSSN